MVLIVFDFAGNAAFVYNNAEGACYVKVKARQVVRVCEIIQSHAFNF